MIKENQICWNTWLTTTKEGIYSKIIIYLKKPKKYLTQTLFTHIKIPRKSFKDHNRWIRETILILNLKILSIPHYPWCPHIIMNKTIKINFHYPRFHFEILNRLVFNYIVEILPLSGLKSLLIYRHYYIQTILRRILNFLS